MNARITEIHLNRTSLQNLGVKAQSEAGQMV